MDPKMRDMGKSSNSKKKKENDDIGITDSPQDGSLGRINGITESKAEEPDPYEWEDETGVWQQEQKRQVRNKVEKRRKEKIRGFIHQLSAVLPPDRSVPKKQQCMNLVLERTVDYVNFLKRQNQEFLLGKGNEQQAEEIKRLKTQVDELTAERDIYKTKLEEKGDTREQDPSMLWDYRKEFRDQINPDNIDLSKILQKLHNKPDKDQDSDGKSKGKRNKKTVKSHLDKKDGEIPTVEQLPGHVLTLPDSFPGQTEPGLQDVLQTTDASQLPGIISVPPSTPVQNAPESAPASTDGPTETTNVQATSAPVEMTDSAPTGANSGVTQTDGQPDILAMSLSGQLTPNSIANSFGVPMQFSPEAENPLQTLASVASNTQNLTSAVQTDGVNCALPKFCNTTTQTTQSLNMPLMSTNRKALNSSGQGLNSMVVLPSNPNVPVPALPNPGNGTLVMNQHGQLILVNEPGQAMMDPNMALNLPGAGQVQIPGLPGTNPVMPGTNQIAIPGTNPMALAGTNPVGANSVGIPGTNPIGIPGPNSVGIPGNNSVGIPGTNPIGIPGTNSVGIPGTNPIGVPGTNQVGVPGTNPIGIPGTNSVAVPGTVQGTNPSAVPGTNSQGNTVGTSAKSQAPGTAPANSTAIPGTNQVGSNQITAKSKKPVKNKKPDIPDVNTVSCTGTSMSTQISATAVSTPRIQTPEGTVTITDQNAFTQQFLGNVTQPQVMPLNSGQLGMIAPNQQLPLLANQQPGMGIVQPPGILQPQNGGVMLPGGLPNATPMGTVGQPSAFLLPNGQIIPVVTQPNMVYQQSQGVNNGMIPVSQAAPLIMPQSKAGTLTMNTPGDIIVPGMGQVQNYIGVGSMAGPAQSYGGLLMTTQSITSTVQSSWSDHSQTVMTPSVQPSMAPTGVGPSTSETFQNYSSIVSTQPTFASSLTQPHLLAQPPVGLPLPPFMIGQDGQVIKNSGAQVLTGQGQLVFSSGQDGQKIGNSSTGTQVVTAQGQLGMSNHGGVLQPPLAGIPMMNQQGQITINIPQGAGKDGNGKPAPGMITIGPGGIPQVVGGQAGTQAKNFGSTNVSTVTTNTSAGIVSSSAGLAAPGTPVSSSGNMPPTFQVVSSNGTLYLTLPPGSGAQQQPIILDPNSLPMLQPKPTTGSAPVLAPAPAPKNKSKKSQRVLMPKPPMAMMQPTNAVWPGQVYMPERTVEASKADEDEIQGKSAEDLAKDKTETSSTTDILAKAAESIFSSSMSEISPTMTSLYNSPEQPLQIDTSVPAEQPVTAAPKKDTSKSRNRLRKKPANKPKEKLAIPAQPETQNISTDVVQQLAESQIPEPETQQELPVSSAEQPVEPNPPVQYSTPLSIVVPDASNVLDSNSSSSGAMLNLPDLPSSRLLSIPSSIESTKVSDSNCSTPTLNISNPPSEPAKSPTKKLTSPPAEGQKSRKRNASKKTSPKINPSMLPETIMFSEADISDVLDQVENLDLPVGSEPAKPGKSRGKKNKASDNDDSDKPEKKKRKQSKANEYDFQDDILPEDPGLHIDLDPPSLTEVEQPAMHVVTSPPQTAPVPPVPELAPPEKLEESVPDEPVEEALTEQEQEAKNLLDSIQEMIQEAPPVCTNAHTPPQSPPLTTTAAANELPAELDAKTESALETLGLMASIDVSQPPALSSPKLADVMSPIRLPVRLPSPEPQKLPDLMSPIRSPIRLPSPEPPKSVENTVMDNFPVAPPADQTPMQVSPVPNPPQQLDSNLFEEVAPPIQPKESPKKQNLQSPAYSDASPQIQNNFNPYNANSSMQMKVELEIPPVEKKTQPPPPVPNDPIKDQESPAASMAEQMQSPGNAQPPYLSHSVESLFGSSGNRKEPGRPEENIGNKAPSFQEAPPVRPKSAPKQNYQNTGHQKKKSRSASHSQSNMYSAENLLQSQNPGRGCNPQKDHPPPMFHSPRGDGLQGPCNVQSRNDFNPNPIFLPPPATSASNMPPTSMPFNMPPSSTGMPVPFSFSLSSSSTSAPTNTFSPQSSQFSFYPLHPSISGNNRSGSGPGAGPGPGPLPRPPGPGPLPPPGGENIGLNLPPFGLENRNQATPGREVPNNNQESLTSPPQVQNPPYPNFNPNQSNTNCLVHHGRNQFVEPAPPLMHSEKDLGNMPPLQPNQFNMVDNRRQEMNPQGSFPDMGRSPSSASDPGSQRMMPEMGRHPGQFTDIPPPAPGRMNPSQGRHPDTSPSQLVPNFQNRPSNAGPGPAPPNNREITQPCSRPSDMGRSRRPSEGSGHSQRHDMGQSPRMGEINQSPNRMPENSPGQKRLSEITPPLNNQPRSRSSSLNRRSPQVMNNMSAPFYPPSATFVNQGPPPADLTSPPLRHPSRGPPEMRPPYEPPNFTNQPQDFNPVINFGTPSFDPPPLELSRESNAPATSQSSAFNSNQASQPAKSSNPRSESSRPPSKRTSAATTKANAKPRSKSKKPTKQQQYEMDTNLSNSIFEPNRSMTPYFPISNMSSPPPRNMQTDGPTYIGNLFGGPSRPMSNAGPPQHHKNPEFNTLFPPSRPQNGLGLNFQPGFGMNHMHGNHGNPGHLPPHTNSVSVTPHMPNFNLSNFFQDINNSGQNDSINISPIKFPHGNPILPPQPGVDHNALQHHHQPGIYHNRPPPPGLHNAISLLGHPHHGFDPRPQAINSSMAPPFHGHGGAPSFGMPPGLNFNMHDH